MRGMLSTSTPPYQTQLTNTHVRLAHSWLALMQAGPAFHRQSSLPCPDGEAEGRMERPSVSAGGKGHRRPDPQRTGRQRSQGARGQQGQEQDEAACWSQDQAAFANHPAKPGRVAKAGDITSLR